MLPHAAARRGDAPRAAPRACGPGAPRSCGASGRALGPRAPRRGPTGARPWPASPAPRAVAAAPADSKEMVAVQTLILSHGPAPAVRFARFESSRAESLQPVVSSHHDVMPSHPDKPEIAAQSPPHGSWRDEPYRRMVDAIRDYAVFLLDPAGHVTSWNTGAERIKGYKAQEIIGRHFSVFYPQSAIDKRWPQHELETSARLGHFEDEGWRVRKDGSRFWANVMIAPIRDRDGVHRGFAKITRDLTEQREQDERIRQSEERFRLLLEGVEDYAVYMLDPEGRVTSWNSGAQRITGYSADEIVGQAFERFYLPEDIAAGRPSAELRTAMLNRRAQDTGWRLRRDGTPFWADVVVTALHDEEGRLRGFAKVVRDLSEKKRIENLEEQGR